MLFVALSKLGDSEPGPTNSTSRCAELYMDASSLTLSQREEGAFQEKHKSKYMTRRTSEKQVQESKIGTYLLGSLHFLRGNIHIRAKAENEQAMPRSSDSDLEPRILVLVEGF